MGFLIRELERDAIDFITSIETINRLLAQIDQRKPEPGNAADAG